MGSLSYIHLGWHFIACPYCWMPLAITIMNKHRTSMWYSRHFRIQVEAIICVRVCCLCRYTPKPITNYSSTLSELSPFLFEQATTIQQFQQSAGLSTSNPLHTISNCALKKFYRSVQDWTHACSQNLFTDQEKMLVRLPTNLQNKFLSTIPSSLVKVSIYDISWFNNSLYYLITNLEQNIFLESLSNIILN